MNTRRNLVRLARLERNKAVHSRSFTLSSAILSLTCALLLKRSWLRKSTTSKTSLVKLSELLRQEGVKIFAIEPVHGTSNRLRAYASAAAIALKMHRSLIISWNPDVHAQYFLSEIFTSWSGLLIEDGVDVLKVLQTTASGVHVYDYMVAAGRKRTVFDSSKHIFVRSAYVLSSEPSVGTAAINRQLRALRPVQSLQRQIDENIAKFGSKPFIGAHIRMLHNQIQDVPGISNLTKDDYAGLKAMEDAIIHRQRCHYKYFIPNIHAALHNFTSASIFVASDSFEAVEAIVHEFGHDKVLYLNEVRDSGCTSANSSSRRNLHCTQLAILEFYLLARANLIFTSEWSSASELVVRLGGRAHRNGCATTNG